jgi:hypothetical protein
VAVPVLQTVKSRNGVGPMDIVLDAVFEHGVFRPLKPISLPEMERFRITVAELPDPDEANDEGRPWRGIFSVEIPYETVGIRPPVARTHDVAAWTPTIVPLLRWSDDGDE